MFRDGYHAELDDLRRATTEGRDWIAALQEREIEATGIKSLKIRYNSVFGYYIESHQEQPRERARARYQRKQTTAGRRAFRHAGIEGNRKPHPRRGRTRPPIGRRSFSLSCAKRCCRKPRPCKKRRRRSRTFDALAGIGGNGAAIQLLPSPAEREPGAIRIRDGTAPGVGPATGWGEIRAQRRGARPRGKPAHCFNGPEHGGQIDVSAPDRAARAHGANRQLCAGGRSGDRAGGPDFHPGRGQRRSCPKGRAPSSWR